MAKTSKKSPRKVRRDSLLRGFNVSYEVRRVKGLDGRRSWPGTAW
jgi:hypothetical protein